MAARGSRPAPPAQITLAPIVLIKGPEGLLVDRALDQLRALAHEADPNLERTDINAATYQAGQLDVITSPSLFGESRMVIIRDLETMSDALADDLIAYAGAPAPDVWMFLAHPGGNARGKKVIDTITKAKWPVIPAEPLKNDRDKLALIASDVRAARRQMDTEAQQALVDALGNDPRAMAGALAQLLSDVSGRITLEDVRRYQAGRVEATGYDVADAAVAGNSAKALTLARHAFATGIAPQLLVTALAMKFRSMAKVSIGGSASALKMAPWQVDRARRELQGWSDDALATSILAVARADAEAKGASRDPVYAVERAVLTICNARRSGTRRR